MAVNPLISEPLGAICPESTQGSRAVIGVTGCESCAGPGGRCPQSTSSHEAGKQGRHVTQCVQIRPQETGHLKRKLGFSGL